MRTAALSQNPKGGLELDTAEAVLFVCYAACRLHPGFSPGEPLGPGTAGPSADWERLAGDIIREAAARRQDVPLRIANCLSTESSTAIGLSRAEVFDIAAAACALLDGLQLDEYVDGTRSDAYVTIELASEIAQELTQRARSSWYPTLSRLRSTLMPPAAR